MFNLWSKLKGSRVSKYLQFISQELQNQKLNRQCIGEDRDGNKYYQYYSYYGLPTRREIRFKTPGDWDIKDLVYYRWLYKFDFEPPTQQEKQQFYLQEKQRYERAALWDKKQELLMEQFRRKRSELLLRNAALKQLAQESAIEKQLNITSKRSQN